MMPLTHDTIQERLRLLRWILKDRPEIITFFLSPFLFFSIFYSSIIIIIIISVERRMASDGMYHDINVWAKYIHVRKSVSHTCSLLYVYIYRERKREREKTWVECVETMDNFGYTYIGSLVSRRDYRRAFKLTVTEVTSGQRDRKASNTGNEEKDSRCCLSARLFSTTPLSSTMKFHHIT